MDIRKAFVCVLAASLLLGDSILRAQAPGATPTPDHHARSPQDIFRVKPLAGGVYALYGRGGNVGFFVGSDAVLVVDSEYEDIAPGIVAQITTTATTSEATGSFALLPSSWRTTTCAGTCWPLPPTS
jgi:hypothetical protein